MNAEDMGARLARRIALDGPMTVADYVTACLHDPVAGYYATRPALGAEGDFITAPLVSQMFGEVIGAWLADLWGQMGAPSPVRLVELGPGDGTLMEDVLRTLRGAPGLIEAVELWLVEPSAPLRARQAERLAAAKPRFARTLDEVSHGAPLLLVANEVFDCLPARQFVCSGGVWVERRIGLGADGGLVFGHAPLPSGVALPAAPDGAVTERSPQQVALAAALAACIAKHGGAALILDYGRAEPGFGDTLQALRRHEKLDPLSRPGEADLTQHVDFPALAAAAREQGVATTPIVAQGVFLRALGLEARARTLAASRPDQAETIARQLQRLTAPDQMGELFKAIAIHSPGLHPAGFPRQEPAA